MSWSRHGCATRDLALVGDRQHHEGPIAGRLTGNVGVWVAWTYRPRAGLITFDTGVAEPDSGVFEDDRRKALGVFNSHGITPECDGTCHHFWISARDFAIDDEDVVMVAARRKTFDADLTAIEIDVNPDQPTIRARNLVSGMIEAGWAAT